MSDDEITRHFDAFAERLENRFDLLSEIVQHVDAKLDRRTDALERKLDALDSSVDALTAELRSGFREVSARIDVSVAQLSDRIVALEEGHSALTARVARLEAALERSS